MKFIELSNSDQCFPKEKRKMVNFLIWSLFLIYWGLTLFYNCFNEQKPSFLANVKREFGIFFFQKWTFFAPPPRTNSELIYVFSDPKTGKRITLSALEVVLRLKRETSPFNLGAESLDYILNGAGDQVTSMVNRRVVALQKRGLIKDVPSLANVTINPNLGIAGLITLKNYARFLMDKFGISKNYNVSIIGYSKPINLDGSISEEAFWKVKFIINTFYAPSKF